MTDPLPEPTSPGHAGLIRLLDVSLNRAAEGLRVVEDHARFVLDDAHLTELAKRLRHGLATAGGDLPLGDRLACRDTQQDVGAAITTESESARTDPWGVCQASLHRTHQALRSLEEYAKVLDPSVAARFERLRYDSYTLAKALGATRRGIDRLADARLYVLIDGGETLARFEGLVESLAAAGADVLQLRDKRLADQELAERARSLVRIARREGVISIVNDRPDVAAVAGADGVHVGQEELSVKDARSVVGPGRLVGVSTHSVEQARRAVLDGADYVGLGPTYPTPTKRFDAFPGLDLLREASAQIALPAFAIGGIDAGNLPEVLATGVSRVAVSSAVTGADDPAAVVRRLKSALTAKPPTPVGG